MEVAINENGRQTLRLEMLKRSLPRRRLTHAEWAEKFVKHATGPHRGTYFRVRRQPFLGLLFAEFDRGLWEEIWVTGMSQSGKTLGSFVIPTLYTAVERATDALIGVPEADMAADKWDKDFLPTLLASDELSWLIPQRGPGSKGGRIKDRVTLENGVDIKIMSRGGQDTNKAGWTAQDICVTELKGFSGRSETSSEADDLRKLMARGRAFKRRSRRVIGEGTLGTEAELPWTLRGGDDPDDPIISTRSRIEAPCPICEAFICPQRKHLVGWQNAQTSVEAQDNAHFVCPSCGGEIWDDARRVSMRDCRLVHAGQSVNNRGEVVGPAPPTRSLWFQWGAYHNLLLDAGDTAVDEWKNLRHDEGTIEHENGERELCQFAHGIPFVSSLVSNAPLDAHKLRKRTNGGLNRSWLPEDTEWFTIGIDLGKWTGWWFGIAFRRTGELYCPAFGAFDVCRAGQDDDEETRVMEALAQFDEETVLTGFPQVGRSEFRQPDYVGVDMNWLPDTVAAFVRSRGRGLRNRWRAIRGRGKSVPGNNAGYHQPKLVTVGGAIEIGTQWFAEVNYDRRIPEYTMNADHYMRFLQDRLRVSPGNKGALTFYKPIATDASGRPRSGARSGELSKVSNHLASEREVEEWDPDKRGLVKKYVVVGENHWADAGKIALVFGDKCGFSLADIECPVAPAVAPNLTGKLNWFAERLA